MRNNACGVIMSIGSDSSDSISRRSMLTSSVILAGGVFLNGMTQDVSVARARAESMEDVERINKIELVAGLREKVMKIQKEVKDLKQFTDDDAVLVKSLIPLWIEPLIPAMSDIAQSLNAPQSSRVAILPLAMQGHLIELKAAAAAVNKTQVLEELEEVVESADEFLALMKK
uniref:Uncharacterized protein n=1 Tax=Timspurckia oligopyrenoides TaxID=708627 RepID=A0A7S0ZKH1_9RHOD